MVITLTGSNSFGLRSELGRLIKDFVAEYGDMALERLDGGEAEFDRLRESLQSLPFLASKKLVVLYNPSAQKQFIDQAAELLTKLPETTDVILVEPKLDKRSSYFKFLKYKTDFREHLELDGPALSKWLVQKAAQDGGSLKSPDAQYLIDRVGPNQQLLSHELDKLLSFDPDISRKNIESLVDLMPQSTIFQLLDAALNGRQKLAQQLYEEQRAQKVEPYAIMAMLIWQLHVLAVIKTARQRSDQEIASEAKLNPFVVRKSRAIANKLSLTELKTLIAELAELDIRLKSESIDPDEALKNLLLKLSATGLSE